MLSCTYGKVNSCHRMLLSYDTMWEMMPLSLEFILTTSRMPQGKPVYYVLCVAAAAVIVMCSCIALQLCSQVLFYSVATVCLELPLHDPDLLSSIATAWL